MEKKFEEYKMKPSNLKVSQLYTISEMDGSFYRMQKLLSAGQILTVVANNLIEESADLMESHSLRLRDIKNKHNKFLRSADDFFAAFSSMLKEKDEAIKMFQSTDEVEDYFRGISDLKIGWKPEDLRNNDAAITELSDSFSISKEQIINILNCIYD